MTTRELVESILLDHLRIGVGGCLCGWGSDPSELGRRHTEHLAEVLDDAGVLAPREDRR